MIFLLLNKKNMIGFKQLPHDKEPLLFGNGESAKVHEKPDCFMYRELEKTSKTMTTAGRFSPLFIESWNSQKK
ncbi:hypothetical protein CQ022_16930 [Chryseobacterium culicis]|uniref:Uncharacterized protein n=2 Tax=Chryseobacterium culicis TaxID=680127 RepID=A0A2S9CPF7_CHRCI|nr:hypothetical protein CQ022_16930 [Chryseobacterium culicis]PRB88754.1 hypothetical protein CQ033_15825 [Chryseobacterium culicis]